MKGGFKLRPPRATENDIERACVDYLRLRGYWVKRQHSALLKTPDGRWIRIGEVGDPDYSAIHAIYPGFLLEIKRPGGKLRNEQIVKIGELQIGYLLAVAVVDSVESLAVWVVTHERKAERKWREYGTSNLAS